MSIHQRQYSRWGTDSMSQWVWPSIGGAAVGAAGLVLYKFSKHYAMEEKGHYKPKRPSLIAKAEENDGIIYYFGVGSNMLRSKVEGRAVDQSKIEIISMEPGVAPGYRVAFNMKAFPPLEPAMASIEPVKDTKAKCLTHEGAVHANGDLSCHGSLIALKPDMYHKIYLSEGGGKATSGYEEVVVRVEPYDDKKEPVDAIAFRTKKERQLPRDLPPSARYMSLLVEGAEELGLSKEFQIWLQTHPVQRTPLFLRTIAVHNMIFTFPIFMFFPKLRIILSFQGWLLWNVYIPSNASSSPLKQMISNVAMSTMLAPGAVLGLMFRGLFALSGKQMPKMMKQLFEWKDPSPLEGHQGVGPCMKKMAAASD